MKDFSEVSAILLEFKLIMQLKKLIIDNKYNNFHDKCINHNKEIVQQAEIKDFHNCFII